MLVQGRHLNLVLSVSDVQVMIGDSECPVTSLSSTQLTCLPNVSASAQAADVFVCFVLLDCFKICCSCNFLLFNSTAGLPVELIVLVTDVRSVCVDFYCQTFFQILTIPTVFLLFWRNFAHNIYVPICRKTVEQIFEILILSFWWINCTFWHNNNNGNNIHDSVHGAVIMAEPLREFTWFIWWM